MSFLKIAHEFDSQQAFAAGFAMAARDAGLSEEEYQTLCKVAAEQLGVPNAPQPPPAATGVTPPAIENSVVPIQTPAQANEVQRQDFVAQKAQQLEQGGIPQAKQAQEAVAKPVTPPAAVAPSAEIAKPRAAAYDPYGSEQLDYWRMAPSAPVAAYDPYGNDQLNYGAHGTAPMPAPVVTPVPKPGPKPAEKHPSPGAMAPGLAEWLKNPK